MKVLATYCMFTVLILVSIALTLSASAQEQGVSADSQEDFVHSPDWTEKSQEQAQPLDSPVKIETGANDARLQIVTDSPLSPYLGAVKKRPDNPEGYTKNESAKPWEVYHLETGVGVQLNEQTKLKLGYRFHDTMTPFDLGKEDPSEEGDVNFSLEINFPF